jgi:tetratricopeptide (TPR) repeat protein
MLHRIIVPALALAAIVGCSTPASVKTTLQAQSQAYEELDANLIALRREYVDLHARLSERRGQAARYAQLLDVLKAMRTPEGSEPRVRESYAEAEAAALQALGARLRGSYKDTDKGAAIDLYRDDLQEALKHFRKAVKEADEESKAANESIQAGVRATAREMGRVRDDIGALRTVHSAIAEYLSIDLSPGKQASRELTAVLEEVRKEL